MPPSGLLMWAASPTRKRAPEPERPRHPLMHLVERDVRDLVVADAGHDLGHEGLGEVAVERERIALVGGDRKHHPPQAGDLQQEVPALGIGEVGYRDQVGDHGAEIERRAHHQKALRPGESFEVDAERSSHVAASPVGADQPSSAARPRGGRAARSRPRRRSRPDAPRGPTLSSCSSKAGSPRSRSYRMRVSLDCSHCTR